MSDIATAFKVEQKDLASVFIGFSVSTTLYGISCLQAYLYFRDFNKDYLFLRLMVAFLWVLDTLSTLCVAHTIYYFLVIYFVSLSPPEIPWSYALQSEVVDVITFTTQIFFAWQIWKVSKNKIVVGAIALSATVALGMDIEVTVHLFKERSLSTVSSPGIRIIGSIVQGMAGVCDLLITGSFMYYLRSRRTGVQRTEKIIDSLIMYAVTRGVLTVTAQLTFMALDLAFPGVLYWLPFQQAAGKLYINSAIASLNARGRFSSTVVASTIAPTMRLSPHRAVQFPSSHTLKPMSFTSNVADKASSGTYFDDSNVNAHMSVDTGSTQV